MYSPLSSASNSPETRKHPHLFQSRSNIPRSFHKFANHTTLGICIHKIISPLPSGLSRTLIKTRPPGLGIVFSKTKPPFGHHPPPPSLCRTQPPLFHYCHFNGAIPQYPPSRIPALIHASRHIIENRAPPPLPLPFSLCPRATGRRGVRFVCALFYCGAPL